MPKKAATTRLTTIASWPIPPDMQGPLDKQFCLENGQVVQEPKITAAQIKRALLAVTDMESGCKFIAEYKSLGSPYGTTTISIEQLIGLARTVALAEKLLQIKEDSFIDAEKYFSKANRLVDGSFKVDSEIGKWLAGKNKNYAAIGSINLKVGSPLYIELWGMGTKSLEKQKQTRSLTKLEQASIDARKVIYREVYTLNWQSLGLPQPTKANKEYLVLKYEYVQLQSLGFKILFTTTYSKQKAAMATLVNVIEQMSATLSPKLDLIDERIVSRYEANDWWSTIALHFRDRLLGAVNPPCLACGQELLNTERSSKKFCNGTCRKRAFEQKKKAK